MNTKLYGFKLKDSDIVNLFNDTDLIGYEKDDNGNWVCNGFSWMVNNPTYIIDSFYDFFLTNNWEQITEKEFSDIVASDDELNGYTMIDKSYPIEKMFNKKVVYADINTIDDLEQFPNNATFTLMDDNKSIYDEPIYYTVSEMVSEIEDNNNIGKYRIIY